MISYHLFPRYLYCIPNYSRTQVWQSAGQSNSAPFFLMILHGCTYYVLTMSSHVLHIGLMQKIIGQKIRQASNHFIWLINHLVPNEPKIYTNLSFEVKKNVINNAKNPKKIIDGHFFVKQPKVNCRQQCNINWTNAFCC